MKTTRYKFEQVVQEVSQENIQFLEDEFKAILESDKDFTRKADYIGLSIGSIDKKIASLDEELQELQLYKKRLKSAKELVLRAGAEIFIGYGIEKLEGASISSITLTKPKTTSKTELAVINEKKLIDNGFYKLVLDEEAVIEAFSSDDKGAVVSKYSYLRVNQTQTPARLKINKRRSGSKAQELVVA